MNRRELERALVKGVRLAIDRAFKWSGNELWPGDTGAENLLQVSIADCISRGSGIKPLIHLEPTLNSIAPSVFGGDSRRVDIGLKRRSKDEFYSLIEVKKYPGDFGEDLDKICSALARSQLHFLWLSGHLLPEIRQRILCEEITRTADRRHLQADRDRSKGNAQARMRFLGPDLSKIDRRLGRALESGSTYYPV